MELQSSGFLISHAFQRNRGITIARTAYWKFYNVCFRSLFTEMIPYFEKSGVAAFHCLHVRGTVLPRILVLTFGGSLETQLESLFEATLYTMGTKGACIQCDINNSLLIISLYLDLPTTSALSIKMVLLR